MKKKKEIIAINQSADWRVVKLGIRYSLQHKDVFFFKEVDACHLKSTIELWCDYFGMKRLHK